MSPGDRELARQRGRRKLDALKRRTGQLRRRVVATAFVGFALLWAVVFGQMATGNDPALGSGNDSALSAEVAARPVPRKGPAPSSEGSDLQATVPPPGEDDEDGSEESEPAATEVARVEAERASAKQLQVERAEAERTEAERIETERREAEARELEELEAVTTGQS